MTNNVANLDESAAAGWERTIYAFLAEKERRSGSLRTVQSYSRMLRDYFSRSYERPDEVTIGARLACVSSFFRFLIRMKVVASPPPFA